MCRFPPPTYPPPRPTIFSHSHPYYQPSSLDDAAEPTSDDLHDHRVLASCPNASKSSSQTRFFDEKGRVSNDNLFRHPPGPVPASSSATTSDIIAPTRPPSEPPLVRSCTPQTGPSSSIERPKPKPVKQAHPRKPRRERPHIKLADDQPPTTQGRPRARVFVACVQCRNRKIRCDGAKPTCHSCGQRTDMTSEGPCRYDTNPKRRGPDKMPGARQRMAREMKEFLEANPRGRRKHRGASTPDSVHTGGRSSTPDLTHTFSSESSPTLLDLKAERPSPRSDFQEITKEQDFFQVHQHLSGQNNTPRTNSDWGTRRVANFAPYADVSSAYPYDSKQSTQNLLYDATVPSPVTDSSPERHPPSSASADSDSGSSSGSVKPGSMLPFSPLSSTSQIPSPVSPKGSEANSIIASPILSPGTQRQSLVRLQSLMYHNDPFHTQASNAQVLSHAVILDVGEGPENAHNSNDIRRPPAANFARQIWWDSLLSLYHSLHSEKPATFTSQLRNQVTGSITHDLQFIFRVSNHWFSFLHVPSFFGIYGDPARRHQLQPALVLALLAVSTFFQSSERERGKAGRDFALLLREHAQSALEASFASNWIDESLAQAAWLLALFEVCAHDRFSKSRTVSSLVYLDSIIRSLGLTYVDADVPRFKSRQVPFASNVSYQKIPGMTSTPNRSSSQPPPDPGVVRHPENGRSAVVSTITNAHYKSEAPGCSCKSLTLGNNWDLATKLTPLWVSSPTWEPSWSRAEIRKESIRRLCWTSMTLAAGHISYGLSLDLFISNPANYALLFSAEAITPSTSKHSPKNSVWALYDQLFLLWHGCVRMRSDATKSIEEQATFGMQAWLAADRIEEALDKHTCGLERSFVYHGREYLFNIRMCISFEFQRYIPIVSPDVNRKKAMEWLSHQRVVGERFIDLSSVVGNAASTLARRPFFVFWFMGQIGRALKLWNCDRTLTLALEVCKSLLPPTDYLAGLWPCPGQRRQLERIRASLHTACMSAGIPPPPPPVAYDYLPITPTCIA